MSRIGKKSIAIPAGVKVGVNGDVIKVEGPKGSLIQPLPKELKVEISNNEINVMRNTEDQKIVMIHGLGRSMIANMIKGVTEGFRKYLEFEPRLFASG